MPIEVICPRCGQALRIDALDDPGPAEPARTVEVVLPATASASGDELGFSGVIAMTGPESVPATVDYGVGPPPGLRAATRPDEPLVDAEVPPARRGPGLGIVLLASYASALTLAGLWLVLSGRLAGREAEAPEAMRVIPGRRADRARRIEPPAPIPPDRRTPLGEPIRVGDLELTPLSVEAGPVLLERTRVDGFREEQPGGSGALHLRLRLRNTSDDAVFAPLDEAFVREPDRGLPDSFLQAGSGERVYPYPLAIESEWAIAGQSFRDLRPGEAFATDVVSASDALPRVRGPMTWRLRLRTGVDRLDVIGVTFDADQIRGRAGRAGAPRGTIDTSASGTPPTPRPRAR